MPRTRCNLCCNPAASCICKWTSPIFNKTSVVILQHPNEARKPLGTAKIVSLCLQKSKVKVGVDFSSDEALMHLMSSADHELAILYPSQSALDLHQWAAGKGIDDKREAPVSINRTLIVLDGTWRNTREIINVNPFLKTVRAVKLTPAVKSNYRIRKAPFADSLSTVEAVSQALSIIEPETSVDVMAVCFQNMIDYQISRMGEEVYFKNYSNS